MLSLWRHQLETFPRYWPFVRVTHGSPVDSPPKGQWLEALRFSLICAWTNGWANNRDAAELRRHRAHYDVTVMLKVESFSTVQNGFLAVIDGTTVIKSKTQIMMTSLNGNIFCVTGSLCVEFTCHRWNTLTKGSDAELLFFFDLRLNKHLSKQSWGWWFETP